MKQRISDLSLFGGRAEFENPVHVGRPTIGDRSRFLERLNWVLDNQRFTNDGPMVRQFEERLAEMAGVRNCVVTANATTAMQIVYQALGLSGGEVIMPSMTYVATAHAARMMGLTPVFCDMDLSNWCMDPAEVENAITSRTVAVVGVHLWGKPCAIDELEKLTSKHGLPLMFDAAHALGCSFQGRRIGGFGTAEVYSFHATKVINSFEGGAIATDDDALAQRVRSLRNFGYDGVEGRVIERVGTNAKMHEVSAAMGINSLEALEDTMRHNQVNHKLFRSELYGVDGLTVVPFDEYANCQYGVVTIDQAASGISRELLTKVLNAENVFPARYFDPACHQLEPYRTENPVVLPNTERLAEQILVLPTGPTVCPQDVRRISAIVRCAVTNGHQVTDRFQHQADQQPVSAQA
ncbi:dTDP-4-dehydro-6-deoxyglucose aminotransferase [Kibdelosporangium aridum]|uniref:dTDP-4-dehydro-6-deoxyglucose aminotransferase n=1 Tax=Kibdelosporangium aridum TaxID=2030 RepID=A0A428Z4R9_KIBAR|nr:aminotransferase class I/II-fold pyridoxal phosphate-dependent enzyme [Kibdelosporangium aridum]RSM81641.1 dTDP-4-dehydro-6-deoxyglucose aminotransferase [Kibdelosporangium aridum]